jgi:hypothetical protein
VLHHDPCHCRLRPISLLTVGRDPHVQAHPIELCSPDPHGLPHGRSHMGPTCRARSAVSQRSRPDSRGGPWRGHLRCARHGATWTSHGAHMSCHTRTPTPPLGGGTLHLAMHVGPMWGACDPPHRRRHAVVRERKLS